MQGAASSSEHVAAHTSSSHKGKEESTHQTSSKDATTAAEKAARDKEILLREEEELQLALALSASEAETKSKFAGGSAAPYAATYPSADTSTLQPPPSNPVRLRTPDVSSSMNVAGADTLSTITEMDAELARYLNRNYWTNRAAAVSETESMMAFPPSAPPVYIPPVNPDYEPSLPDTSNDRTSSLPIPAVEMPTESQCLSGVPSLTSQKQEEFLDALRKSIDVFVNRMRVNSQRGRPVGNDSTLQTLFHTLHAMQPQLLQYFSELEHRRAYLEKLQDDSTQLREAREALDALRHEHAEQRRLEEEEANRQRQMQMMQKVEVLRQQKRDAMEAQRRLAIEQTRQYEQQYQYQHQMQQPYGAVNSTGMPFQMMSMAAGYPMQQPQQPGPYMPGMEYAYGQPVPPGGVYMYGNPPTMEQGPSEGKPEESNQQPAYSMQGMPMQNEDSHFGMQDMMQALPPPTEAPRQYIPQPGAIVDGNGMPIQPANLSFPVPPSNEPQFDLNSMTAEQEDSREVNRPASSSAQEELICLE